MVRRLTGIHLVGALVILSPTLFAQTPLPVDASALVKKIQDEIAGRIPVQRIESSRLHGEMLRGSISNPRNYPGSKNDFQVYIPNEYNPARPACVLLKL